MRRNKQWICYFIALFILLSGMCLETLNTDTVLFSVQQKESTFIQIYNPHPSFEARAEELSRTTYSSTIQRISNPTQQIRRNLRVVYELLYIVDAVSSSDEFYITENALSLMKRGCSSVVVNYIHNTDGKKRI